MRQSTKLFNSRIGKLLAWRIILFSSVFTLFITITQLYLEYIEQIDGLDSGQVNIVNSYRDSIQSSLWVFDEKILKSQARGIANLPTISYVEIQSNSGDVWVFGKKQSDNIRESSENLWHDDWKGKPVPLGKIILQSDVTNVYQQLLSRAIFVLMSNSIKTFFVAGFILFLFTDRVARHLIQIENYLAAMPADQQTEALRLHRKQSVKADELVSMVSAINTMIEELQTRTAALHQSKECFRDFASATSDWFWESDAEGNLTFVSEAYWQLTRFSPTNFQTAKQNNMLHPFLNIVDPAKHAEHHDIIEAHLPFRETEQSIKTANGHMLYVTTSGVPKFSQSGEFLGYRGTGADRTEFHDIEVSNRQLEEQLRQDDKMRSLGQLTGGIAHDFNNLLGVILGNVDLIQSKIGNREERLASIRAMVKSGGELTRRLLSSSHSQQLTPKPLNLNTHIENLLEVLQRTLGETIEIKPMLDPRLWNCNIDPFQLENTIVNLSINARDAISNNGILTLETSNAILNSDDGIQPGEYVQLKITDTGSGIDAVDLKRIFEPFFTTKKTGDGTGLGLSIVYGFITQSDGYIKYESEIGQGTTVIIQFPRFDYPIGITPKQAAFKTLSGSGETIVLVEDNTNIRYLLQSQLEAFGYKVLAYSGGNELLSDKKFPNKFDLLVTDIGLPGSLNGVALSQQILGEDANNRTLYISGNITNALLNNEFKRQPLEKPFSAKRLANLVREILDDLVVSEKINHK
ncbi:MAG: response regulator [Methylococcales bacterium]|nr:response regulator [Methylococcales bacterium]